MMSEEKKTCTKCLEEKNIEEFILNNKNKREARCKVCTQKYSQQRYLLNKQKILEQNKKWRDEHKEYRAIKDKEYRNKEDIKEHIKEYNKNRDKEILKQRRELKKDTKKEYDKEYREKNKEKIIQYRTDNREIILTRRKKYYDENKEVITEKNRTRRKYTNPKYVEYMNNFKPLLARKLNSKITDGKYEVSINIDDLIEILNNQNNKCYISKIEMTCLSTERQQKNVSIDQKISGSGYTKNNVALCCEFINMSKMQMSIDEFIVQLKIAGENIENNFHEKIIPKNNIGDECKEYLLNLFRNKKIIKKIGEVNIINLWKSQGGKCALTGIDMTFITNNDIHYRCPTNISVDKINPTLGYVIGNIQLTCLWANTGKLNFLGEDYKNLLLEAYNNIKIVDV
jgi:hypothetical protein